MNDILRQRLLLSANIAANAQGGGDISGFAFALLHVSGLNVINGYFISSENHISNIDARRLDVMVEVIINRQKILVIECKKDTTHPRRSRQQLFGYMQDGGFPNGILMTPTNSTVFTLDLQVDDAEVQQGQTYSNLVDIEEIIHELEGMRIHELE